MPALNFKKQFADMVRSGYKRQTIRAERKRPFKDFDTLYLFTGMRTKNCERLRTETCKKVESIEIRLDDGNPIFEVNGKILSEHEIDSLAFFDGFNRPNSANKLFEFFKDRLPFKGQVIYW